MIFTFNIVKGEIGPLVTGLPSRVFPMTHDGNQEGAYLLSPETVRQATKFYGAAKRLPYRSEGPRVSDGFIDRYVALTRRQPVITADTASPRGTLTLFLDKVNELSEIIRSKKHIDRNDPQACTSGIFQLREIQQWRLGSIGYRMCFDTASLDLPSSSPIRGAFRS